MKRLSIALVALVLTLNAAAPVLRAEDAAPGKPSDSLLRAKSSEDEVKGLFREGYDLYRRGHYEEAYQKLEKALERGPSSDLVLYLRNELGVHTLQKMMREAWESNDPAKQKIGDTAMRLLKLSAPVLERVRKDPQVIQGYIDALKKSEFDVVWSAIHHLVNIGPYAIPYLVNKEVLGNEREDDFRTNAIICLVQMRDDAVWPLIEALNSPNPMLRQNAAIVLGHIRDERAIAALKWALENANEAPEVKYRAAESILKITGSKKVEELKPAKEYYFLLAEKYYYALPTVMRTFGFDWLQWRWDVEKDVLLMREVPPFALNELMAEEACLDGLAIDPEYAQIWALLGCVQAAQLVENTLALENADEKKKLDLMTDDELKKIKDQTATFERSKVLANIVGRKHLYKSLDRSLDDGTALVSVCIINSLRGMVKIEELPASGAAAAAQKAEGEGREVARPRESYGAAPLIKALTDKDKRVRYAASGALLDLNPPEKYLGVDTVLVNLVDAVGEMGARVVLIVHDVRNNDDRRAVADLEKKLISLSCFPVVATSPREGVVKAKSFPSPDLIILHSKMGREIFFDVELPNKKSVTESAWESLRDDVRTKSVPKYILCEDDNDLAKAKEIYEDKAWYLKKPVERMDLKNQLDKTFATPEAAKDTKGRAEKLAQDAAEALARLDPFNTIYSYREAVPALIKNLDPQHERPDAIRLPCVVALGRYGDARALDALAQVAAEKKNDKAIRAASAKALSEIYRQTALVPATAIYDIMKGLLLDGELDVEVNVGEGFGNSAISNPQRRELQMHRRLHGEKFRPGTQMQP
jgi:HEAT repeat protein